MTHEEKVWKLYKELQELWGIAGMQAKIWVSNCTQVVAAIPEGHRASEILITDDRPVSKTQGFSVKARKIF